MLTPLKQFDFTTAVLSPSITFARAGATATRVNSSGYIESVAADTARFDYSKTSIGACLGLLIEQARTNACLRSSDATASPWLAQVTGTATIATTQNYAVAPDNTQTAARVLMNLNGGGGSTANYCWLTQPIAVTSGTTYTASFWAKTNDGTTKTISLRDDSSAAIFNTLKTVTSSWQRIVVTGTAGSTVNANFKLWLRGGIGTSTSADISVWGFQWETGAFETSYIPTVASAVTRNADVATITGTNFSDWWQAGKGGVLVRARPGTVSGVRPWVQFDDGTVNEIIAMRGNTTNPELYIVDGGVAQAQIDAGTIAANTDYSLTGWWATNDCKARLDSGAVVTDTSATIPTVTQARLGSDGTNYLNGHLSSISYYDSFSEQIYTRRKNKAVFSLL